MPYKTKGKFTVRRRHLENNIKLGRGGIREIDCEEGY